jgi:hypothetical protein
MMSRCYYLVLSFLLISIYFENNLLAQQPANGENEYRLAAVNRRIAGPDTIDSDAGRGVWVAHDPDLDNDGKPEILITEYTKGGRVLAYEVVDNDRIEFIWSSKVIHDTLTGGYSSPRMVTTGDFDNNGLPEIIFPVGYFANDSFEYANRGIYFYEWTGNDNDFGTEPVYKLTYEQIDSAFSTINCGITENGITVRDIDGDGRNELLFPPRVFNFSVPNLYIMQVTSGTFAGGDANIEMEYIYDDMKLALGTDGYVPVGLDIGDVDNDGLLEIIVAGWTNIGAGQGVGFIQVNGADSYTPGSIVPLSDFSGWAVKAKPIFTTVNGNPVIYLHGSSTGGIIKMWIMEGIISDQFVTNANIYPLFKNLGWWSAWALGDQDHPTNDPGDGLDLYLYSGGGRFVDIEYNGTGAVTDSNSYTVTPVFDLAQYYTSIGGLFNDFYCYPGMDIDNDGLRDLVTSYKGWALDSLGSHPLDFDGFHIFMFEWGDSLNSISLDSVYTGVRVKPMTVIMPEDYKLEQNYPNPFNPVTNINFTLPLNKTISLQIYNTLGQEVRTLINNKEYLEGSHTIQWDGTDNDGNPVASGVYVYKLIFGNFSQSKRMTLVR